MWALYLQYVIPSPPECTTFEDSRNSVVYYPTCTEGGVNFAFHRKFKDVHVLPLPPDLQFTPAEATAPMSRPPPLMPLSPESVPDVYADNQYLEYSTMYGPAAVNASPLTELLAKIASIPTPLHKNKLDVAIECIPISEADLEKLSAFCISLSSHSWTPAKAVEALVVYKLCHGMVSDMLCTDVDHNSENPCVENETEYWFGNYLCRLQA